MTEKDAALPSERIAAALAQLRGPRPSPGAGSPPWAHPGSPGRGGPWGAGGHGEHGGPHGGRGPFGGKWGEHGPMARFAARFRLLEALAAASAPLSVSELAERIGVDQPRASRLVQAAVAEGHVRREANAADARRTDIVLTDAGRAVVSQARGARVEAVGAALADFTPVEADELARLLAKLAASWPRPR
ncbi:MarR family winged helix-turn-helix transcriptional regulator [Microbacterium sp. SLBN-146]|uniref:MarR family winged helix-turn-helix transcriptional regulator n=1 Tax=Microbacterium sp. SLBN-146 TaxID=2768457 RepID=UPI0021B2CF32|nr:MarR family winged helix-turn-helix transcriptional regulator [Microbacterium sp. SLBN-146]